MKKSDLLETTKPAAGLMTRSWWLKPATLIALVLLGTALTGCPNQRDTKAEDELRAEVARLKAEADADTKAKGAAQTAQAEAEAARLRQVQVEAAQTKSAADIAAAEAEMAKANAEADAAAKIAAEAQKDFLAAQAESEKAKADAAAAKLEAEKSQEAAVATGATKADVDKSEADANKFAAEVARAESARLKKELARAKAKAAAQKIQKPLSEKISDFLTALSTVINQQLGGPVYSINSNGSIWVKPNAFANPQPFLMSGGPAIPMVHNGQTALTTAQLQPSGVIFNPKVRVFFDLLQPMTTPWVEVLDFKFGSYSSFAPPVYAYPTQNNNLIAYADMDHFCVVGLFPPELGAPEAPKPTEVVDAPPTEAELIAKEKQEETAESALNKQFADSYQLIAKTAQLNFATGVQKAETKSIQDEAAKKAKAAAEQKAKAAAAKKAKALADQRAREKADAEGQAAEERSRRIEEVRRQAQEEQQQQQFQQQQRQQQLEQQRQQQQQRQQPTPNEDFPSEG